MADRIKGITIEIGGDTTKLASALKDVNNQIKDTQSDLKDVEKLLKLDPSNVELLTQKHELLGKAIGETKDKLKTLKDAQEQMKASGVDKSSEEYQRLEREIIDCEQALKKLEKQSRQSNATLQKVAESGKKLKSVGDGITEVGKKVSVVSGAVATGFGAAVKTTMDFDSQMSKVKAISGATEEEFTLLRDKAREMGASTKFSASEAAEAFEYMAMAGWKTEDMLNGIAGIMNLSASSGEDLATTADIVTDAMTAMNIEITNDNVNHFVDVLAQTSRNANTNVAMMGETFKYVAPLAGTLGYKIDDVALGVGLMANSGIKATQAGTAMRGMLTRMADPTKEVANAMEELGISLSDKTTGRMYSFKEIMEQIRGSFGTLKMSEDEFNESLAELQEQLDSGTISEKEFDEASADLMTRAYGAEAAIKAQYASILAGKNALSGYLAIVNASDDDFNKLSDSIAKADGTAEEMSKIMQDNLGGQLQVLKSQLEELGIAFGDILIPYVQKFVEWLQKLIDKFNGMSEWQKKIVTAIGMFIVVLGPLLVAIGSIITAVGQFLMYAPVVVEALAPVLEAIGAVVGVISGPVLVAIGAVIAAIVVWIKNWDDIKLAFQLAGEIIMEKITAIKDKFFEWIEGIKQIVDTFKTIWRVALDFIFGKADSTVEKIKNGFKTAFDLIKALFKTKLEFPKIKLPHISISGGFSLNPPKAPSFSVKWFKDAYNDAYLLNSPTIFGASGGKLLGGGDGNGSEAVVGTDKLMSMMSDVVGSLNIAVVLEGDAQGVFNLVRTENNRFMKANGGYSPFMA